MGWDGYKTLCRRNLERLAENVYLRVAFLSWRKKGARRGMMEEKREEEREKELHAILLLAPFYTGFFSFSGEGLLSPRPPTCA